MRSAQFATFWVRCIEPNIGKQNSSYGTPNSKFFLWLDGDDLYPVNKNSET